MSLLGLTARIWAFAGVKANETPRGRLSLTFRRILVYGINLIREES